MRVYLDHAATTPVDPQVLEAMLPYYKDIYGNPSSIHGFGREAKNALESAREKIASLLGAGEAREIIFTGGGSESDNLAITGVASAYRAKKDHIITSAVEHHAVYDTCKNLEKQGFSVTYLPVDEYGLVTPEQVAQALTERTILVTIMHANNEVGTIMPIAEISRLLKERGILFHTDAVQTAGSIPVNVKELGVDLLSISAHKFYGPKGAGALYIRKGVKIDKLIHGGAQERDRRAGTENVAGVVGMAKALELAVAEQDRTAPKIAALRDYLISRITGKIGYVRLNGHPEKRLPGNANFSFEFVEGESILLNLDLKGIAASSGSACTSGSLEPSHVLTAMGICHELAHGSIRFSIGRENTREELDYLMEVLPETIERLRAMSPLYESIRKECGACTLKR
ncbi:MAG: cysteine desulfurase NifS [Bacillota bacterium]